MHNVMGGSISSQTAVPVAQATSGKPSKPVDNVVIIPVDGSKEADMAFTCKCRVDVCDSVSDSDLGLRLGSIDPAYSNLATCLHLHALCKTACYIIITFLCTHYALKIR